MMTFLTPSERSVRAHSETPRSGHAATAGGGSVAPCYPRCVKLIHPPPSQPPPPPPGLVFGGLGWRRPALILSLPPPNGPVRPLRGPPEGAHAATAGGFPIVADPPGCVNPIHPRGSNPRRRSRHVRFGESPNELE